MSEWLWVLLRAAAFFTGFVILLVLHRHVTALQTCDGFFTFEWRETARQREQRDQKEFKQRFDEELHKARIEIAHKFPAKLIHFAFVWVLCATWALTQEINVAGLCHFVAGWVAYIQLGFFSEQMRTEHQFRMFEVASVAFLFFLVCGAASQEDLAAFDVIEKFVSIGMINCTMIIIDIRWTLPFHFCQTAVLTYFRWKLIGFANMTPILVWGSIVPNLCVAAVMPLSVHVMRSTIAAKLDSGDASSLMMGFRQILRGVCNGDFVLDPRTMTIVDDARCLERVLKSNRRYSNCNFLELFLDSESRDRFSQFLGSGDREDREEPEDPDDDTDEPDPFRMPRGLRVSLQGGDGPVSMDLFYTKVPRFGSSRSSSDYYLFALKEDPEQKDAVPPEAPADSVPHLGAIPAAARSDTQTRSSVSDAVMACDDLVELALLLSDVTEFVDIEEVHLCFRRQSEISNIESGMPTLRKFIRPFDWERIERMFDIVTNLPAEDQRRRCHFQRPTLFRVPGESRSYLRARSTSLRLADEQIVPGRPSHFWMHLTQFDSSQIQRPREQELEGIEEER